MSHDQMNWCPSSFEEFRSAATAGRVMLSITNGQYPWLYNNVLPFRYKLLGYFTSESYEKKLLQMMVVDEGTFRRVHDQGIDLILLRDRGNQKHTQR